MARTLLRLIVALGALTAACSPASPAGDEFTLEEHALRRAPAAEPHLFEPLQGTMSSVLESHASQRAYVRPDESILLEGRHAIRVTSKSGSMTAIEGFDPVSSSSWVTVSRNGQEIYRVDTGMPSPIPALRGFWALGDQWFLETAYVTAENYGGRLSRDGELLQPLQGPDEAFDFQPLNDKPFYFVAESGTVDLSYDGRTIATSYDEVPHYQCCSASVLNPLHAQDMLAFFARRGATWYYVEAGFFK